jgi:hypothetical protein
LGDDYNLQGSRSGYYENDTSGWVRSPDESTEGKPNFDHKEGRSKKPGYAKAPRRIPDNPAEIGRGARTSPSRRGHLLPDGYENK